MSAAIAPLETPNATASAAIITAIGLRAPERIMSPPIVFSAMLQTDGTQIGMDITGVLSPNKPMAAFLVAGKTPDSEKRFRVSFFILISNTWRACPLFGT